MQEEKTTPEGGEEKKEEEATPAEGETSTEASTEGNGEAAA